MLEGIFAKKSGGILLLAVGAVLALILIFLGSGTSKTAKKSVAEPVQTYAQQEQAYRARTEKEICTLLSQMDGISEVNVMVRLECGEEAVYGAGSNADGTPARVKTVCPKIIGIGVVCRGGDNAENRLRIISLLTATFHLESNRVYVTA